MSVRLTLLLFCLLLPAHSSYAAPGCTAIKSQPDVWVSERVDVLVRAAHAAYEDDAAVPRYEKVLDGINATLKQCKVSENDTFANRYRNFVEYIGALSLDRQPDHELGFVVADKQYFAETSAFVEIPEFLLDQRFLRPGVHRGQ